MVSLVAVASCFSLLAPALATGAQIDLGSAQAVSSGFTMASGASVTYTVIGTAVTVAFGASTEMGPVCATVLVDAGATNSPVKGNLIERGVNTLRFDITDTGCQPRYAVLTLRGASADREWTYQFTSLGQSGVKTTIAVPLTRASWKTVSEGDPDAMFAMDLQNVTYLSLYITPSKPLGAMSRPAQSYTFENFVAVNDDGISSSPASLTPLEKALIARFGYGYGSVDKLTGNMKAWDADGDGMADYIEIQCENDEAFANAMFAAKDIKVTADGAEITWTCVKDAVYTVVRTDAAGKTFAAVAALSGIGAADTGFMTRTDTAVKGQTGPFYYRILKQ